ncbi:MAG: twitching motility two-component system response regulator PilH [Limisphaerales bacterium]|jgi:twitching motility two-component system response regulator PilH
MFKVLVIDDSRTEAQAMHHTLESRGYEVSIASCGEEGVVTAAIEQPDIILMDVVMPGLNGFQATRQIKHSADTKHIPVIIVSGKDQAIDIIWGERQGAANYLVKPVQANALISAIEVALTEAPGKAAIPAS